MCLWYTSCVVMNDGAMPLFFGYNMCWFEGWPGHA